MCVFFTGWEDRTGKMDQLFRNRPIKTVRLTVICETNRKYFTENGK